MKRMKQVDWVHTGMMEKNLDRDWSYCHLSMIKR